MKRLTTGILTVFLLAAMPGVAIAQEAPTTDRPAQAREENAAAAERQAEWLAGLKTRALEAIDKRLVTIAQLESAVNRSETVAPDHAGQLLSELRAAAIGLEGLAAEIRAAGDLETLWRLVPMIFEDYRIYAIVTPKVHLVLAADAAGAIAGRLESAADTLGEVLQRLADGGINVADGEALLAEMERLVASGSTGAASVPGAVINLAPADYPGSSETLRSAHATLTAAGQDLRSAGETAHEIARFIKSVAGDT